MAQHGLYIAAYLESAQAPAPATLALAKTAEDAITLALGRLDGKANAAPKNQADLDAAIAAAFNVSASPFADYYDSYCAGFANYVAGVAVPFAGDGRGSNQQVAAMAYRFGAQDARNAQLGSRSAIAGLLNGIF